jgi:D-tyrosyl-tRNA(Tyr) deacylase
VRIVLQRVSEARVLVAGRVVDSIGRGYLLLVGIEDADDAAVADRMAAKVAALRLFPGEDDRAFDRTLAEAGGAALVVSQFTLMGDVRRGNRPSWAAAARPERAEPLVEAVAAALRDLGVPVGTGEFGASMQVTLVNDGPVTLVLDSAALGGARRSG